MTDGGSAFPLPFAGTEEAMALGNHGMSLRAWFAGQAMAGYRAFDGRSTSATVAERCVLDADALIAELEK